MLRRIPATPLVCLVIFLSILIAGACGAANPDESLEILLKPNKQGTSQVPAVQKAKSPYPTKYRRRAAAVPIPYPPYAGISKVKPPVCGPGFAGFPMAPPCILATPRAGQWELSAQAFFATIRGNVMWPRYNYYYYGYTWQDQGANFVDHLQLPRHDVVVGLTALYQFRPTWGVRYQVLFKEFVGGGNPNDYFWFGAQYGYYYGTQGIQSKWDHAYHRVGLVYDALRTCNTKLSVFADWVHMDDKISLNCIYCGWWTQTFSKGADAAIVGLEGKRCLKSSCNGGTLSCEWKAGAMFLDNVEGWDVEAGARYSIPLNGAGRWGYVKGGYRLVDFKKSQNDFVLKHALEGGFMEFGFIF